MKVDIYSCVPNDDILIKLLKEYVFRVKQMYPKGVV